MKGGAQTMASAAAALFFGPYKLQPTQIFYESSLSVAITNLKPIVEGHVLVIPKRVCARFRDLTQDEVQDLFFSGHKIQPVLEQYYGCTASNLAIQDGAEAGQSVPHVHLHILPRKAGDFKRNDDVYDHLEQQNLPEAFDPAEQRHPRTNEEMEEECLRLRLLFPDNVPRV